MRSNILSSLSLLLLPLALSQAGATRERLDENEGFDCSVGCPRILEPICATDGADNFHYFHNECLMQEDGCRSGRAWSEARMTSCLRLVDPVVRAECTRPCPFNYDPICATNGHSYQLFGNRCVFGMENCLANGKWKVARRSECGGF